jgi:hypothetical protein
MSISKTTGVGITNMQAMAAAPGAPSPQSLNIYDQTGGKAGIWMSGMAPAVDEATNRVWFVTGYVYPSGGAVMAKWLTCVQQRKRRAGSEQPGHSR